ncbi:hypothetical protein Bhyg_09672 [Pseudolycoriella hygida]|uniref:Uncharacterized protein n=1 Tax=Pseudolycoriella hygida TaxID=35572 RepID=A0A9Q0RYA6_9DIPT|nr:hypothetical protein Bhyg_09672 [Pseudolycoriella hygida]
MNNRKMSSKRSHKARNPKHKSNRYKNYSDNRSYINGIVRYQEENGLRNKYRASTESTKHYPNGVFSLRSVQKFEDNYEPPYIKKFNRRNKQLLNILEGIPESNKIDKPKKHVTKSDHKKYHWVEVNLFEEQRPYQSAQNTSTLYETDSVINEIPGERDSNAKNDDTMVIKEPNSKNHSKSEKFNYHRVASPKLVGFGSFGMLRKQQLPFVAITDKRLSHSSSRAYSQQPSNLSMP